MLFHLFATACILCNWFDNLGRIGYVWSVFGQLLAHQGLLYSHLGETTCVIGFSIGYSSFGTLASFELLVISAVAFGSFGFLACFLVGFGKLA